MRLLDVLRQRWGGRRFRYRLALCAIFKDEARYLDEWIGFHGPVGVDHFYLYDNGSSDEFRAVLAPWIAAGAVTLIDWPGDGRQTAAYNDCLKRARRDARWLAFIDIDEFLFSPRGAELPAVLEDYADLPAVFVYWRLYGSSGHDKRPTGPSIEAFTRRLDDDGSERLVPAGTTGQPRQGKSILNPRRIRDMGVHLPVAPRKGTLDERRRPPPQDPADRAATIVCDRLRINHYWSRSIEDLREKAAKGRVVDGKPYDLPAMLVWESELNAVEDRVILALPHVRGDPERARQPLTLDRYDDIVLSAATGEAGSAFRIGAHTRRGTALTEFNFVRGGQVLRPSRYRRPGETLADPHLYGGTIAHQFGHFLLESLARSWAFNAHPGLPIVWQCVSSFGGLTPWQIDIVRLLGIDPSRFRFLTRATAFERLLAPAPGYRIQSYAHPDHVRHMARHPFRDAVTGKRVWLSRSRLPEHLGGRVVEEPVLEATLARRGWTIVSPETLSVAEQLRVLEDAAHIAGFVGSAFHILLLASAVKAHITLVRRSNGPVNLNYRTIAAAKGLDQVDLAAELVEMDRRGPTAMSGIYRFSSPAEIDRIARILDAAVPSR